MTSNADNFDILIVGGGVMGISLAWELAQHGEQVCVVDRGQLGQEASWAGAGMVPAGPAEDNLEIATAYEKLEWLSQQLHAEWHERLLDKTGISNEYRQCGSMHVAPNETEAALLQAKHDRLLQIGTACESLDAKRIVELEPALEATAEKFLGGFYTKDEAQLRNPRHLQALIAACKLEGVTFLPETSVEQFEFSKSKLIAAKTPSSTIRADRFCITAGCWTGQITESLGLNLPIKPMRGQIVLLNGPAGLLNGNVYIGYRQYFTPRSDGRILVGATQEDVGFNKSNTSEGIANLTTLANTYLPAAAQYPIEKIWAGLRPGTIDDLPFMGRIPQFENAWLAAGHFRAGLQLSPATAVVMRCLMQGTPPPLDISELGVERVSK